MDPRDLPSHNDVKRIVELITERRSGKRLTEEDVLTGNYPRPSSGPPRPVWLKPGCKLFKTNMNPQVFSGAPFDFPLGTRLGSINNEILQGRWFAEVREVYHTEIYASASVTLTLEAFEHLKKGYGKMKFYDRDWEKYPDSAHVPVHINIWAAGSKEADKSTAIARSLYFCNVLMPEDKLTLDAWVSTVKEKNECRKARDPPCCR